MLTMRNQLILLAAFFCISLFAPCAWAQTCPVGPVFRLPTKNQALFTGNQQDFYMYVDRTIEGKVTHAWEGGTYGFTRTLVNTPAGKIASKFHGGIDISPIERDANGVPQDIIHPIAPGVVVYTSPTARASNYGKYVIIAHAAPEGRIFSLYAHLAEVTCQIGDKVNYSTAIGVLGFTGVGLDKRRAHLHLEIMLMITHKFEDWFVACGPNSKNAHGLHNGINFIGFNPTDALKICRNGQPFSLSAYLASLRPVYRVRIPAESTPPPMARMYPFLTRKGVSTPASWEIDFLGCGLPVGFTPSATSCLAPELVSVLTLPYPIQYRTMHRVSGTGSSARLTNSGLRYCTMFKNDISPRPIQGEPTTPAKK